jgi:hypothetical protein
MIIAVDEARSEGWSSGMNDVDRAPPCFRMLRPTRLGQRFPFVITAIAPTKAGSVNAVDLRSSTGEAIEPFSPVVRLQHDTARHHSDQRRRNAAVRSVSVGCDEHGCRQTRSRRVLQTRRFPHRNVGLASYPLAIGKSTENETAPLTVALDYNGVER